MKKKKLKQELLKVYQIPPSCQKQNFFPGQTVAGRMGTGILFIRNPARDLIS